jgi:hypothetical protein
MASAADGCHGGGRLAGKSREAVLNGLNFPISRPKAIRSFL